MKGVHIMANINNGSKLTDAEGNLVFPQTDANYVLSLNIFWGNYA